MLIAHACHGLLHGPFWHGKCRDPHRQGPHFSFVRQGQIEIEGTGKFYYPSGATYEGQWKLLNPPLPPPPEDPKEAKKKKPAKDEPPPPPPEPPKRVRHGQGVSPRAGLH